MKRVPKQKEQDHIDGSENLDTLCQIDAKYFLFTGTNKVIADYFRSHREDVLTLSISQLAKKIGTTPSAITRFCQKLHYNGWSDFRYNFQNDLVNLRPDVHIFRESDTPRETMNGLLGVIYSTLSNSLVQMDPNMVELAAKSILHSKGIVFLGDGPTVPIALCVQALFLQIGIQGNCLSNMQTALAASIQLKKGDVLLYICRSGASKGIAPCVMEARKNGATVIGIISQKDSVLAQNSSVVLPYSMQIPDDVRYLHIARICELSIIGALQITLINMLSQQAEIGKFSSKKSINSHIIYP